MRELLVGHSAFGQDPALKAAHIEEQVWIVLAIHGDERILPLDRGYGARQTILQKKSLGSLKVSNLNVPEDGASQVHVVFHQAHPSVAWPTLLVVVADDVLVIRVRMLGQITLNQIARFFGVESKKFRLFGLKSAKDGWGANFPRAKTA